MRFLVRVVVLVLVCMTSMVECDFQVDALCEIKNSLNDSSSQLQDWLCYQISPCTWSYVYCDEGQSNVLSLFLQSMGFSGSLSPKIGVLKTLNDLFLDGNMLTGEIPMELGNLTNLIKLDLTNNHLTGQIPASLGNLKQLEILSLSHNNLSGKIPESLLNLLPSLTRVELASNHFSGDVPNLLFQVPEFNFSGNALNCGKHTNQPCASITSSTAGSSYGSRLYIGIGVIGGIVLIGFVLVGGVVWMWRQKQKL